MFSTRVRLPSLGRRPFLRATAERLRPARTPRAARTHTGSDQQSVVSATARPKYGRGSITLTQLSIGAKLLTRKPNQDGGDGQGQQQQKDPLRHALRKLERVADFEGTAERDEIANDLEQHLHVQAPMRLDF